MEDAGSGSREFDGDHPDGEFGRARGLVEGWLVLLLEGGLERHRVDDGEGGFAEWAGAVGPSFGAVEGEGDGDGGGLLLRRRWRGGGGGGGGFDGLAGEGLVAGEGFLVGGGLGGLGVAGRGGLLG